MHGYGLVVIIETLGGALAVYFTLDISYTFRPTQILARRLLLQYTGFLTGRPERRAGMLVTEVEGSLAIDRIKDIDAAALHSCVAARELGRRGKSASSRRSKIPPTMVLIRTHSLILWKGTSKAAVPHSVMYLPSYRLPRLRAPPMDVKV